MNLYFVKAEYSAYVVADSFEEALVKWRDYAVRQAKLDGVDSDQVESELVGIYIKDGEVVV